MKMIEIVTSEDLQHFYNEMTLLNAKVIQLEKDFKTLVEELNQKKK